MSGGHFNYEQYKITDIADEVEHLIETNNLEEKDEYGDCIGRHFEPETIAKFKEALITLRRAQVMAQRIDWLVSCDDGEESFHKRWGEDLAKIG